MKDQGFRVIRTPAQERPKKRGEGTTTQGATATLWARPVDADPALPGEVLATGVSEVNAAITERLGFGADQFRQVILLPQGEFRKLLSSDSTQRQAVLETLFQTSSSVIEPSGLLKTVDKEVRLVAIAKSHLEI